jgi:hypothetical protein
MLHPKHNRIDYGEQLIPPPGYELVRAIGTTYCLDLEALMVLPVALFYAQLLDQHPEELRFDMLEAITKASSKITVFYQNGQLKVPRKYHHLMAYWESGIVPVTMPNHVSSFHPKVWIIRYESKEEPVLYRLLITSRNLTFNREWDIAFATDGKVQGKEEAQNKPLVHFLTYLNGGDKKISSSFISDLLKVKFEVPLPFEKFKFIPVGIENPESEKKYVNPITNPKHAFEEMLIVSPFLDNTTLGVIKRVTNKPPYLLSRKEELDGIEVQTLDNFNTWQFSRFIQEAEKLQQIEEGVEPLEQSLHAKLFITLNSPDVHWYLGSANCTDPAQGRNVEFMIQLIGSKSSVRPKEIFKSLTDSSKADEIPLFTPYDFEARLPVDEQKRIDLDIRKIKYDLAGLKLKGLATQRAGTTVYDLQIEVDALSLKLPTDYRITVKPLPEKQRAPALIESQTKNVFDQFGGYPETLLSPFLEFEISTRELVCSRSLLSMEIILPESRLNRIFTSIIDSRDKFLKYLSFLLTGEEASIIENVGKVVHQNNAVHVNKIAFAGAPVYEKLLIAASRFPHKLKSIDNLVERIKSESETQDEQIITPEFESFWDVFRTFINNKK